MSKAECALLAKKNCATKLDFVAKLSTLNLLCSSSMAKKKRERKNMIVIIPPQSSCRDIPENGTYHTRFYH